MHILETSDGEVYITTFCGGISQVELGGLLSDKIDFFHYNKKNGLPSDIAFAMVENNADCMDYVRKILSVFSGKA